VRYKVRPEDFVVEEQVQLPLAPGGPFAVYRVHKRGVTTLAVRANIARALGLAEGDVGFPAIKDRAAVALQHATVRGTGPAWLSGEGFTAEFVGRSRRPLSPRDVAGNRFTVVLRDLSPGEAAHIARRLDQVAAAGLPNYFDEQRFGSLAPGADPIGKRILQRDAEGALRAYLTQPFAGDPARVRAFKRLAAGRWGDWEALFEAAPRPSNFRSVLTYLRDHPLEGADEAERAVIYRKALNLITRRLLSLYLAAYQSLLWNRVAGRWLAVRLGQVPAHVELAGERLPLYHELPPGFERDARLALPGHRAVYARPELAAIVGRVLAEEGLALGDLKARVLKRAYLPKGERPLLLFPGELAASPPEPDERFPGRSRLTLTFALPRGSYAMLVLKALVR